MPVRLPVPRRPVGAVNVVLALLVVGGAVWAFMTVRGEATAQAGTTTGMRTVTVRQGSLSKAVTADGSVSSAATASAGFVTSGTVTEISVTVGQTVAKGQVLAKVDPAAAQRALNTANANRTAAGDALVRATKAGSDTTTAENQVAQADLAVDDARAAVDGTTLTAPMAGTVVAINGTLGGPSGGSQAGSGAASSTGFIDIADLTKLQVTAKFAEADATQLKTGQAARVTWNALQGAAAQGKVQAIDPQATTTNNVVTYGVTVGMTKLPEGVKPGQTVSVAVVTGTVANAIQVNSAAVRGTGDRHTVTVLANGKQETRTVKVGLKGDTAYEIISGLDVGEQVVLPQTTTTTGANQGGFPGGGRFGGFQPGGPRGAGTGNGGRTGGRSG